MDPRYGAAGCSPPLCGTGVPAELCGRDARTTTIAKVFAETEEVDSPDLELQEIGQGTEIVKPQASSQKKPGPKARLRNEVHPPIRRSGWRTESAR
jgi:hypothetical protein